MNSAFGLGMAAMVLMTGLLGCGGDNIIVINLPCDTATGGDGGSGGEGGASGAGTTASTTGTGGAGCIEPNLTTDPRAYPDDSKMGMGACYGNLGDGIPAGQAFNGGPDCALDYCLPGAQAFACGEDAHCTPDLPAEGCRPIRGPQTNGQATPGTVTTNDNGTAWCCWMSCND